MNTVSAANQEEAAAIAAEFVSGLDNLPNEVQHLLAEIRQKENRAQEIQQDIQKETTKYIRHTNKGSITKDKDGGKEKDTKDKDALIPAKVDADYKELDQLAVDKIALASRLVELLTRVNARLDHDLSRVVALSGEHLPPEHVEVRGGYIVSVTPTAAGGTAGLGSSGGTGLGGRVGPGGKLVETLRAISTGDRSASPPTTGPSAPATQKRRRLNTTSSNAAIPLTLSVTHRGHTPQARSRLGQQIHPSPPPRSRRAASSLGDEDAEGEEDGDADADGETEESGDTEDKALYCFCQKMSYGEGWQGRQRREYAELTDLGQMIACDNPHCEFQWFHLPCVGVKSPLPDNWYCDDCLKTLGGVPGSERGRKGRRK